MRDYPQLAVRVPRKVLRHVQALAAMRGEPQWRIVCAALECYLEGLPGADRRALRRRVRK